LQFGDCDGHRGILRNRFARELVWRFVALLAMSIVCCAILVLIMVVRVTVLFALKVVSGWLENSGLQSNFRVNEIEMHKQSLGGICTTKQQERSFMLHGEVILSPIRRRSSSVKLYQWLEPHLSRKWETKFPDLCHLPSTSSACLWSQWATPACRRRLRKTTHQKRKWAQRGSRSRR
jgi:hypothetical protein